MRVTVIARCRAERWEPPTFGQIFRLVNSAVRTFEERFCRVTEASLDGVVARLEELIGLGGPDPDAVAGGGERFLYELKSDPGVLGTETFRREVAKLERARALGLSSSLFQGSTEKLVLSWRDRAARLCPSDLLASPREVRVTLLAALCHVRTTEITDNLVELLVQLVRKIDTRAEKRVEKVRTVLRGSYSHHYRRLLPDLPAALEFRCNNTEHRPVMDAVELLARYKDIDVSDRTHYARVDRVPLEGVVPRQWRDAVVDEKGRVERIPYELSVLKALREAIRRLNAALTSFDTALPQGHHRRGADHHPARRGLDLGAEHGRGARAAVPGRAQGRGPAPPSGGWSTTPWPCATPPGGARAPRARRTPASSDPGHRT